MGHGHSEVARLLLAVEGVDPDPNDQGFSPLFIACEQGYVDIVRLLAAEPGVDVDARDEKGDTPLDIAKKNGQEEVVDVLLAMGKDSVDVE